MFKFWSNPKRLLIVTETGLLSFARDKDRKKSAVVNGETMKGCSELDTKSLILWFTKTRLSRLLLVSRSIPPEV